MIDRATGSIVNALGRAPWPVRALVAAIALAAVVAFTPTGRFLRELPYAQAVSLVRILGDRPDRETRRERVLGPDYVFIREIRDATPGSAVILFSDPQTPSPLGARKAKDQLWASYFLHPRRVVYLYQQSSPWFEQAEWLFVDGPTALSWITPERRPPMVVGEMGVVPFDMGDYLADIESGDIARRWLPRRHPLRPRGEFRGSNR